MNGKRVILLLVIAGAIVAAIKQAQMRSEAEWRGLSESEARAKLDAKLPPRIPDDKRAAVSDKVIGRLDRRGWLATSAHD